MFELLFTGLYLGAIHLFSSPDHLATVLPLSLMDKKRSWQIGLIWGIGHFIGILMIGGLFYYFKKLLDLEFLEHYEMLYIAVLLLGIGLWILYKSSYVNLEKNTHHLGKITLGTGVFHGIFAVSHIYSLSPILSMHKSDFFYYFLGFALGSIFSVMAFTSLVGFIPKKITNSPLFFKKLLKGSALLTLVFGGILIVLFFLGIGQHSH